MQVNVLDTIDEQFLTAFHSGMHAIAAGGTSLAYWLAYITLAFSTCMMLLQAEPLNKMLSKLLQMGLLFGIFFGLIKVCGTWIPQWINSFMKIGAQAGNLPGVDPSGIFDQGLYLSATIAKQVFTLGILHLPTALVALAAAFFIIIIYAFIAANLAVLLIKAYALITVGPIIFALGANEVTRPTVSNYVQKLIGMGLNILTMYLVLGAGIHIGESWVNIFKASASSGILNFMDIFIVIGGLMIFYQVVQNVPAFIATISGAGGFRDYGQAAMASAMAASVMAAKAVTGAPGAAAGALGAMGAAGHGAFLGGKFLGQSGVGAIKGAMAGKSAFSAAHDAAHAAFKQPGVWNKVKGMGHVAKSVGSFAGNTAAGAGTPTADLGKKLATKAINRVVKGKPKP